MTFAQLAMNMNMNKSISSDLDPILYLPLSQVCGCIMHCVIDCDINKLTETWSQKEYHPLIIIYEFLFII